MFYVFTIDVDQHEAVRMTLGAAPANILFFPYANMPAIAGDGIRTDLMLESLEDLDGHWGLILPSDVLPHVQALPVWSRCKPVGHLSDPMSVVMDVETYLKTRKE